jgi:prepilin-type N-terminal cleavage/methylation domain-containing protein/prepilin-type processing-associated H-X9-DG protein
MRITRPTASRFARRSATLRCAGFTLLEVSAVIFIISILVSLLCAALNHTKFKALRVTCLDNMKQLQQAWWMYAVDNDEALPLNQTAPAPPDPRFPQFATSMGSWVTGNPKQDVSVDGLTHGTLFQYVASVSTYRCPMDYSTVPRRPNMLRTRSYSMNGYLGGDPELIPSPKYKFGQIGRPENVFVFIEEHQESRWHSNFLVPPPVPKGRIIAASSAVWWSTPAERHSQGCNISFADGHMEYWRWYAPKMPSATDPEMSGSSVSQARDFGRLQSCLP